MSRTWTLAAYDLLARHRQRAVVVREQFTGRRWGVACHDHGTTLTRFLPRSWDHRNCQSWDHLRRACRGGRGRLSVIASGQSIWRSRVAFREVRVHEVREVLRHWLGSGLGLRPIAERAGVDRKTARRYIDTAVELGVVRECGLEQLSDELIGAVINAVRPERSQG